MKAKIINVQIVKNLGNYETIRIGGEWELNGENLQDAIHAAVEEIEQAWSKLKSDKHGAPIPANVETPANAESGKKTLRFKEEAKILQTIVKRVQSDKAVTLETVEQHYLLDDDARKCIEAAIKLRG